MRFLRTKIFTYVQSIIDGKRKSSFSFLVSIVLWFLSLFWSAAVSIKNGLYHWGIFRGRRVPGTVISVGNIVSGGTGKTPLVLFLAREFLQKNLAPAVLSRGYLSNAERKKEPVPACVRQGPLFSWKEMGDEPYLLARRLPKIDLFVGKNRVLAAEKASKSNSLIILDDGLQYRKLERDFEIITIDAGDPFAKGRYLPWGYLRDSLKRLQEADLLVASPLFNEKEAAILEIKLQKFSNAPLVGMTPVFSLKTLDQQEAPSIKGISIGMFCAIAKPENFIRTLLSFGVEIVDSYIAPDHEEIPLKEFSEQCLQKNAKYLICTEKDAVKVHRQDSVLPILYVEMDFRIIYGKEDWEKTIEKMLNKRDNIIHKLIQESGI